MAVSNPFGDQKDNYELVLSGVRKKIKTKFAEFIDCLKVREGELLRELDNILASYLSYRSELEKVNEKRNSLEKMKRLNEAEIATSPIRSFQENIVRLITDELKSINAPIKPKLVSFECDSNKMLAELNKLGKLADKVRSKKSNKLPLVSVCEAGKESTQGVHDLSPLTLPLQHSRLKSMDSVTEPDRIDLTCERESTAQSRKIEILQSYRPELLTSLIEKHKPVFYKSNSINATRLSYFKRPESHMYKQVLVMVRDLCRLGTLQVIFSKKNSFPAKTIVIAGVRLEEPAGSSNGIYEDMRYFECEQNQALFLSVEEVFIYVA